MSYLDTLDDKESRIHKIIGIKRPDIREQMRESYTKEIDGEKVSFEVELDALEHKKEYPWLFSVFVKFAKAKQSDERYEEFLETKEALIIALEYYGNVIYVGSREIDGWSEIYFHAKEPKELEVTASKIVSAGMFAYECSAMRDAKWNFYEVSLYPSELELHNIQSAHIIELLVEEGDDTAIAREVEHYISFDTQSQLERFKNRAAELGFVYKDDIESEDLEHGMALVKVHTLLESDVAQNVKTLYEALQKDHGHYEGWSTVLACEDSACEDDAE